MTYLDCCSHAAALLFAQRTSTIKHGRCTRLVAGKSCSMAAAIQIRPEADLKIATNGRVLPEYSQTYKHTWPLAGRMPAVPGRAVI